MNNARKLFAFSLSNLNRIGCLSEKNHSNILLLMVAFAMGTEVFNLIVILVQFYYMQDNLEEYVKNCAAVAGITQGFMKWIFCLYYKNKFIDLIKYTDYFWNANKCSNDAKRNIGIVSQYAVLTQKMYTVLTIIVVFFGCIESLYTKELLAGSWSMGNKNLLFTITWISMLINVHILTIVVSSFDGVYLGLCYELIIQCKILCDHLAQLNVKMMNNRSNLEDYFNELKSCIDHHIIILRFHSKLKDIYSVPLLLEFMTTVPYLILQMTIFSDFSSFTTVIYLFTNYAWIIFQLALYCIPASQVTDELLAISDAAYNSDWYSQHFSLVSTSVVLIIQRAQRPEILTACGLIEFNREVFVKMIRFGISTCIALRNLKNMEN